MPDKLITSELPHRNSERHIETLPPSLANRKTTMQHTDTKRYQQAVEDGILEERARYNTSSPDSVTYGSRQPANELMAATRSFVLQNAGIPEKQPHPGCRDLAGMTTKGAVTQYLRAASGNPTLTLLEAADDMVRATPTPSSALPELVNDLLRRALLAGWAADANSWRAIADYQQVEDFRPTEFQYFEAGMLAPVDENGVIQQTVPGANVEVAQAGPSATILYLSRQLLTDSRCPPWKGEARGG